MSKIIETIEMEDGEYAEKCEAVIKVLLEIDGKCSSNGLIKDSDVIVETELESTWRKAA